MSASSSSMPLLPTFDDVRAASERIAGHAHRTPVLTSRTADAELGAELFFKCENFQRMGAFKFRGAFNALSRFDERQRRAGVVAFSSGNHAQAIALSARILGMPAVIVMPHDAPAAKVAATKGYGAEVVVYDRYKEDREAIGRGLADERGMTLIPPYDHPDVIAGQGTAALELIEDVGTLDALFVCLGGGGLLSGSALSARTLSPSCKVYGVEPAAGDDGRLYVPDHPARRRRCLHRQRCGAGGGDALLRGADEDGRRADRLPGLRRGATHERRACRAACRGDPQRRQRRPREIRRPAHDVMGGRQADLLAARAIRHRPSADASAIVSSQVRPKCARPRR